MALLSATNQGGQEQHVSVPVILLLHGLTIRFLLCVGSITTKSKSWREVLKGKPCHESELFKLSDCIRPGCSHIGIGHVIYRPTQCFPELLNYRFCSAEMRLCCLPGWEKQSWGYHADDGWVFLGAKDGHSYGPTFDSKSE